jgi:hypothetical protein
MSCSTKASRSAGVSVSSTTSRARPIESASTASCSGLVPPAAVWSMTGGPTGSSRRDMRDWSMFRDTRATIVVSQPPRFSTSPAPARLNRSQASCTASSASLAEPSTR